MKMKFKDGKTKAITLSYDDGVVHDIRLIDIMNKYGIKGTFNINSGYYLPENVEREKYDGRMKLSEAKQLYINSGHEVAVHSMTHPDLTQLDSAEIIYEITEDRRSIEENYGVIARGMAYPFGRYNDTVADILKKCSICYARTIKSTHDFRLPENWLYLHPTCHHGDEHLYELIEQFVNKECNDAQMFYLWGHSYEFATENNWEIIEKFAEIAGGHEDIWYATNIEIYDYVMAYERLQTSYDKKIIYNPSCISVWVGIKDEIYYIKPGQTLKI